MAAPFLVEADVNLGREVYNALRVDPILAPSTAMWIYDEDAHEWRFLIATEDAVKRGPRAAYLRVRSILKKTGTLDKLPLRRFVVVSPNDPVVKSLQGFIDVAEGSEPEFYECVINGMLIPGAHIYSLNRESPVSVSTLRGREHAQK